MKLTSQQTIITLVTRETGYSKELVEVVYSNSYKTLRYYLTNRVADVIKLEKFLKFKDNEKEQHARWSSSRGSS